MSIVVTAGPELRTERLLLRRWRQADREPFAAINADPRRDGVLPCASSRPRDQRRDDRALRDAASRQSGFGLWAVELPGELALAGFVGLLRRPDGDAVRARRRGRLASDAAASGERDRARGGRRGAALRLRRAGARRRSSPTRPRQRALAAADGAARHEPRSRRGLRAPEIARGHRLAAHVLYRLEPRLALASGGSRRASGRRRDRCASGSPRLRRRSRVLSVLLRGAAVFFSAPCSRSRRPCPYRHGPGWGRSPVSVATSTTAAMSPAIAARPW